MEKRFLEWIVKKKHILFFTAITGITLLMRWSMKDLMSGDMMHALLPWYEKIKNLGGLKALSQQIGDYNIFYQTLIAILTYIPVEPHIGYKIISVVFDYLLAIAGAFFVTRARNGKIFGFLFNLVYCVVLCVPTVMINSAAWGQCDAIYVSMVLIALCFLWGGVNYKAAFIFLGLGFVFKLQTIFILPFIVLLYLYRKNFSAQLFLIPAFILWLSGIPAYLMGRSLFTTFQIYFLQTGKYHKMYLNYPSFWVLFGDVYDILKDPAIFLTAALCGLGIYVVLSGYKKISTEIQYLNTGTWFVWTVVLFLPAMHERYSYMLDVLLTLLCFLKPEYLIFCVGENFISTITYKNFLFGGNIINLEILAAFNILLYIGYSYFILRNETQLKKTLRF